MHAGDVLHPVERLAKHVARARILREGRHGIESRGDRRELGERCAEPVPQEPPPHARPAPLHRRDEAAGGLARSRRALKFEAPQARRIDRQHGARLDDRRCPKMAKRLGALSLMQVPQKRTCGTRRRTIRVKAEPRQRRGAVVRAQRV